MITLSSLQYGKSLTLAVSAITLSLLTSAARAQLEEVIITAQKKAQNLQDVSIAVSAFSSDTLRNAGVENITDVTAMTPGFSISNYNPTTPAPYIRGAGTNSSSVGDDASVGVFIDEVYAGRAGAFDADMFDIARVEVLRGPQGTLYGRNVAGGAVNIITNNPTEELAVRAELSAGSYDLVAVSGLISGPLNADAGVRGRLAVSARQRDGWVTNVNTNNQLRNQDNLSARGKIDFDISSALYLRLSVDYSEDDLTGPAARATEGLDPPLRGRPTDKVSLIRDGFAEREIIGASARLVWDVKGGTFTSITAYRSNEYAFFDDMTGTWTRASLVNEAVEDSGQFTQEFRFTQTTDTIDYTVGLYFFDEEVKRFETFDASATFGVPGTSRPLFNGEMRSESFSVFGELSWMPVERWTAIFGGRYNWDNKQADLRAANPDRFGFLVKPYAVDAEQDWKQFTPKLGLEFQASESVLLYASWAEGYKAGGFNGLAPIGEAAATPFDEEIASNYETGLKGEFLDQTLRLNASLFFTDYQDLQNFFVDFDTFEVVTATADAKMRGLELELWHSPLKGLDVFLAGSWLDTQYTKFEADPTVEGNNLMRAPQRTASGGAQYLWPLGNTGDLLLRVDAMYSDTMYFSTRNIAQASTPSYTLVNARVGLQLYSGWNLSLWGRNLTDATYAQHSFNIFGSAAGDTHPIYGPPRMWGISVAYSL